MTMAVLGATTPRGRTARRAHWLTLTGGNPGTGACFQPGSAEVGTVTIILVVESRVANDTLTNDGTADTTGINCLFTRWATGHAPSGTYTDVMTCGQVTQIASAINSSVGRCCLGSADPATLDLCLSAVVSLIDSKWGLGSLCWMAVGNIISAVKAANGAPRRYLIRDLTSYTAANELVLSIPSRMPTGSVVGQYASVKIKIIFLATGETRHVNGAVERFLEALPGLPRTTPLTIATRDGSLNPSIIGADRGRILIKWVDITAVDGRSVNDRSLADYGDILETLKEFVERADKKIKLVTRADYYTYTSKTLNKPRPAEPYYNDRRPITGAEYKCVCPPSRCTGDIICRIVGCCKAKASRGRKRAAATEEDLEVVVEDRRVVVVKRSRAEEEEDTERPMETDTRRVTRCKRPLLFYCIFLVYF